MGTALRAFAHPTQLPKQIEIRKDVDGRNKCGHDAPSVVGWAERSEAHAATLTWARRPRFALGAARWRLCPPYAIAPQIQDRLILPVCKGPGSAAHHFVLRCARDTYANFTPPAPRAAPRCRTSAASGGSSCARSIAPDDRDKDKPPGWCRSSTAG